MRSFLGLLDLRLLRLLPDAELASSLLLPVRENMFANLSDALGRLTDGARSPFCAAASGALARAEAAPFSAGRSGTRRLPIHASARWLPRPRG